MMNEEIIDFNKRCEKFLGDKGMQKICSENAYHYPSVEEMQFHSDWNWIMELIEAIEKLDNFYVQIEESACYIYDILKFTDEQCNPFISCDLRLNSKKEAVVQAIDSFLKFYNKNLEMSN